MSDKRKRTWSEEVGVKERRKLRARSEKDRGVWFGLGMFGLVGWTVAIPALAGLAVGLWIDARITSRYAWSLMGLLLGVVIGCFGAWRWVKRESRRE